MKKTLFVLLMVLALTVMLAVPALAEETAPVSVNGEVSFEDAVAAVAGTDNYIVLEQDIAEAITVASTVYVDLNGHTISGDVAISEGATLKVFDNTTSSFDAVPETYGMITGTVTGDLARTMNTPKATFGNNYKYIAIKEADGYSFHRIYLTVKSVVLSPNDTGVNYRTVFKCNSVVAQYIADYGVRLADKDYSYGNYTVAAGGAENSRLARVNQILDADVMADLEAAQERAETVISASAIITLNDGWSEEGLTVSSATVGRSLAQQIAYANGKYDSLTEKQQGVLTAMYTKYAELMCRWNMDVIGDIRLAANPANPSSHCLCGANVGEEHIGCDGTILTWEPWTSVRTLPTDAGNYYLVNDVTTWQWGFYDDPNAGTVVNLDLNGHTVTSTTGDRAIFVHNNFTDDFTLNITDSSANHKGIITRGGSRAVDGALIWMRSLINDVNVTMNIYRITLDASGITNTGKGAGVTVDNNHTLNMYDVTLKGGKADGNNGGALYIQDNGTVNAVDCTISAVGAVNGGTVYMTGGMLNLTNSMVNGAPAEHGGAVYLGGSTASVTMEGGLIKGADVTVGGCAVNIADAGGSFTMKSSAKGEPVIDASGCSTDQYAGAVHVSGYNSQTTNAFTMDSGRIIGCESKAQYGGGSVSVQGAYAAFTMNGGTITGGKVTETIRGGGNVCILASAKFYMNGGTITGGKVTEITGRGGNVCILERAKFYMNGGTITGGETTNSLGGGVYVSSGTTFQIGGSAKITGNVGNDLYVDKATNIIIGTNWVGDTENAIVVSMADGIGKFAVAGNGVTLTKDHAAYFSNDNGINLGEDGLYVCNGETTEPTEPEETEPEEIVPGVVDPSSHCLCGANVGEEHIGCDGTVLTWEPWTSTKTLPTAAGNYYLTSDVTTGQWGFYDDPNAGTVVNLDLNGHTITSTTGDRAIFVHNNFTDDFTLNLTDSSANHKGTITRSGSKTVDGALIWMRSLKNDVNVNLNIYRITLDASGMTNTGKGAGVTVERNHILNMYDVILKGGTASSNNGGALYIQDNGAVSAVDCTISAVGAVNGGAVYIAGGTLNLTDSTVNGAPATLGGAIYLGGSTASVTMEGGLIKGANVTTGGCAVNIADAGGSFTMRSSAEGEPVIDASGCTTVQYAGAVHVSGYSRIASAFTMESGKIIGCESKANHGGGSVLVQGADATFTMNGGTVSGGNVTEMRSDAGGGNVRITAGAKFYMNGGTITGGEAVNGRGGGVCVDSGTTFRIGGDAKITGNRANDLYLASGATITIAEGWEGNGSRAMVVMLADGNGVFTTADNATDAHAAHFSHSMGYAINAGTDGLYVADEGYRIGYGEASMNPYTEQFPYLQLSGYGTDKTPTTIDEYGLSARCLAFTDQQGDTVLLMTVDLNYLDGNQVATAKERILAQTGVPATNILISACHQHSAPFVSSSNGGGTAVTVKLEDGSTRSMSYQDVVYEALVKAAQDAIADQAAVNRISYASTHANDNTQGYLFNVVRNYKAYDSNGNFLGMNTTNHKDYAGKEAYLAPESEADDELQLVRYDVAGKDPIIMANFQTHPHLASGSSTTHITSDVVGVFRDKLSEQTGSRVIYFSGAGGNINPTSKSYTGEGWSNASLSSAKSYGTALAAIAAKTSYTTLNSTSRDVGATIRYTTPGAYYDSDFVKADGTVVDLATRQAVAKTINDAGLSNYSQDYALSHGIYSYYHAEYIVDRISLAAGVKRKVNIIAYSVGDIGFAGASYEMFDTNGMEIKNKVRTLVNADGTLGETVALKNNGFQVTFVATQANGTVGYIPSQLGYINGGYSVDTANVEAGTGEHLVDIFMEMLSELNPAD